MAEWAKSRERKDSEISSFYLPTAAIATRAGVQVTSAGSYGVILPLCR